MSIKKTSRYVAWKVLCQAEQQQVFAEKLLSEGNWSLTDVDNRFCRELVMGVIKNKSAIDYQLNALLKNTRLPKLKQLQLLRLGIYQAMFLDRVPDHALVYETVEIAKKIFSSATAGFVNAVLRRCLREGMAPLPDKNKNLARYLSVCYSFPVFVVEEWIQQFGVEKAESMMAVANQPAPMIIRVNRCKTDRDCLIAALNKSGIECEAGLLLSAIRINSHQIPVESWPGYAEGWFYFQDTASQLIGMIADPKPGEIWLDACAAPGGKTTHMAELMEDKGQVFAFDINKPKRKYIVENHTRLGLSSVRVISDLADAGEVDGILVDAPCSGLGTLCRHPETKWRLTPEDVKRLSEKQLEILNNVSFRVKEGGKLIYSTCTTTKIENEKTVEKFLAQHDEFEMVKSRAPEAVPFSDSSGFIRTYPSYPTMDGMFAAVMVKKHFKNTQTII